MIMDKLKHKKEYIKITSNLLESLNLLEENLLFKFKSDIVKEGYIKLYHETTIDKLKEILKSGLKMNKGTLWASNKLDKNNSWMYGDIAIEFEVPEKYCHKVNNNEYHIYHDIPKSDFIALYTMTNRTEIGKEKLLQKLELNESLDNRLYNLLIEKGFKFNSKPVKGASYLMPDGMFLGMQENENILNPLEETGKATHPDLDYWLYDNGFVTDEDNANRTLIKSDNAVRLNDGTNFENESAVISLPKYPLTNEQYKQLENWLYKIIYISKTIDVGDEVTDKFDTYKFIDFKNEEGYLPEDIIKLIRKRYSQKLEEKNYPIPNKLYNIDKDQAYWPEDAEDWVWWKSEADKWAEDYAKSYRVKMSPKDFLDLTTTKGADSLKVGDDLGLGKLRDLDIDEFNKETYQNIFLEAAFRDPNHPKRAQVIGHEGRHRMFALMQAGVKSVDVEIICDVWDTEYNKYKPFELDMIQLVGQFNKKVIVQVYNPIPMSWKKHKLIRPDLKDESLIEKIVKVGNKWQVQSEKGRNLGTYDTKEEAENRLKQVEYFKHLEEENLNESLLLEKKRSELINKSKRGDDYSKRNQLRGRNRWERRKYSKISTSVADYNKIDMNAFWKGDILEFGIKVQGETDNYVVNVLFEKILERLRREIEYNKNKLEFKCILRALINTFNSEDVYIHCTCPDFKYRFDYWSTKGNYNSGTPQFDPGKGIANPADTKGAACKHVNLILSNMTWMMKIASVINNYIYYCKDNMELNYAQYIFPKLYGMEYDKAIQLTLFDTDELTSDEETINLSNALGRRRTQFKPKGVSGGNPRFERPKIERENPNQLKLDLEEPEEETTVEVEEES